MSRERIAGAIAVLAAIALFAAAVAVIVGLARLLVT
jgi:hypothetical protein